MLICCMGAVSCTDKRTTMQNEFRKTFMWAPAVAAPYNYPVEIKYAFVGFGDGGDEYPVMDRFVGGGLGVSSSAVDLNEFEDSAGYEMPNSIDVLWLSYCEAKYYRAKVNLPQSLQLEMLEMFRKGYILPPMNNEHVSYNEIVLTLLPKGRVWIYLCGWGRRDLICDTIQAREVEMSLKDFNEDAAHFSKNTKEYCKNHLEKDVMVNLQANGIPKGLWERYGERFNYDIKIAFEDKKAKLSSRRVIYRFSNGEYCCKGDGTLIKEKARPSMLSFDWNVVDTLYSGNFYFDEQEVLNLYHKAFGKNLRQSGDLIIRVSKYNNKFDIFLRTMGKEYLFKKTMIHDFRTTPKGGKEEEEPFYNNHRGINSEDIKFIGG